MAKSSHGCRLQLQRRDEILGRFRVQTRKNLASSYNLVSSLQLKTASCRGYLDVRTAHFFPNAEFIYLYHFSSKA